MRMNRNIATAALAAFWLAACAADPAPAKAPWARVAAMPTPRSEIAAAALDGRLYVAGGVARFGTSDALEAYEPAANRWMRLAPMPVGLHHTAMAALGGRLYLAGGYDSLGFTLDRKEAWSYAPVENRWRRIADMPAPRAAHKLVALGDRIYAVGGVGPNATALWSYDPTTDRWSAGYAPLPTAREHVAAAAAGGRLYVIAGRWHGRGNLKTVEAYDPATDRWARLADLPTRRAGHTAATLAGRIHAGGGEDVDIGEAYAGHWIYDPATDRWTEASPLPTPRHGLDSGAIGGKWYVVGGGTSSGWRTIVTLTGVNEAFAAE